MYKRLLASSQYRVPPTGDVAAYNGTTNLPAALDNAISAKLTINVFCAVTDPSSLGVFKFKVSPARVIVLAEPDIVTLPKISTDPVTCNEPETIADPVYGKVATFGANDADVAIRAKLAVAAFDAVIAAVAKVANVDVSALPCKDPVKPDDAAILPVRVT